MGNHYTPITSWQRDGDRLATSTARFTCVNPQRADCCIADDQIRVFVGKGERGARHGSPRGHHAEEAVFQFLGGSLARHDGILEAGRLEGYLPSLYRLCNVEAPFVRPVASDIVDDGLDRF